MTAIRTPPAFGSLGLPRLAAGVGGLDWANVKPPVRSHLGGLTIPLFVFVKYHKGVTSAEPGL